MTRIENRTFAELQVGDSASIVRTLTRRDIELFAIMSGDVNPAHVDEEFEAICFTTSSLMACGAVP
jgi:acyl dehydratase